MLKKYKTLVLYCKCWEKLVKYKKKTDWRLIKIHKDRISEDFKNIFINNDKENTDVFCPTCGWRIATVKCINGKYVNKLNQGMVWQISK